MSEKILKISIFVAVLTGLLIYSTFFIVKETHQAIVLQLGEPKKVYKDAGLYFKIPFIQKVEKREKLLFSSSSAFFARTSCQTIHSLVEHNKPVVPNRGSAAH